MLHFFLPSQEEASGSGLEPCALWQDTLRQSQNGSLPAPPAPPAYTLELKFRKQQQSEGKPPSTVTSNLGLENWGSPQRASLGLKAKTNRFSSAA